jgi:hypothetical protein
MLYMNACQTWGTTPGQPWCSVTQECFVDVLFVLCAFAGTVGAIGNNGESTRYQHGCLNAERDKHRGNNPGCLLLNNSLPSQTLLLCYAEFLHM